MGALCQAVSFGEIPMMLNGPWLDNKIHVRGRAEMPLMSEEMQQQAAMGQNPWMGGGMPDPSQMTILIQEEEWDLVADEKEDKLYKGTYALRQRPQLPKSVKLTPEHAPVNMIFHCEVTLGDEKIDALGGVKAIEEEKNPNDPNNGDTLSKELKNGNADDSDECAQDDEGAEPEQAIVTEFDDLELD